MTTKLVTNSNLFMVIQVNKSDHGTLHSDLRFAMWREENSSSDVYDLHEHACNNKTNKKK